MGQEIIDIGASPNDGLGDPIRTAFEFTNDNFTQLFAYPNPAPPATLIGKNGDVPGMYAYSPTYFYYCFGTYDGTSVIWAELPTSSSNIAGSFISNGYSNVSVYYNSAVTVSVAAAANIATFTTSGITLPGNVNAANVSAAGYVYGNGAFLTGIAAIGTNYSNANVANYLPTYSGNIGNISVSSLTTPNTVSAGGNITTNGYFIGTFLGNISGNLVVPGANTQVIYNNNGNANAVSGFTYNTNGNVLTVLGTISAQSNVTAANVNTINMSASGLVQAAAVVSTGSASFSNGIYAGNSITSNGYISAVGNIYGNFIFGKFVANTTYANVANTVNDAAQPNITSVSNTLTVGNISLNGTTNTIIANTSNSITVNTTSVFAQSITGTLVTNAQPNITSVGTLINLSVNGIISGNSDISIAGNINSANNATLRNNVSVGGMVTVTGNVSANNISASNTVSANNISTSNDILVGNSLSVTSNVYLSGVTLSANTISAQGTIASQGIISATGNIISSGYFVGTFLGNIAGNIQGAPGATTQILFNTNGNVDAVSGFTFTKGPNTLAILGPITAQGTVAGSSITTCGAVSAQGNVIGSSVYADALYGNTLKVANTAYASWFVGTVSAPGTVSELLLNQNGNISNTTGLTYTTVPNLLSVNGNITASDTIQSANIIGNVITANQPFVSSLANIVYIGAAGNGTLNTGIVNASSLVGTILTATQNNITTVGTLFNLSVNGTTTSGQFIGNGISITNINGPNVTGVVPLATTALFAGTVTTNAQPNITTVGTLTTLTASGNITAPYFIGNVIGNISGNLSAPGANTNILFNNNGVVGASAGLIFNTTGNVLSVTGVITSAANISGSNLNTTGLISAGGNVIGGNIDTTGLVSATGTVTASGFVAPQGFFVLPRYSSAQIAALTGMAGGELVYNTSLQLIQGYQLNPATSTMGWVNWTVAVYQ